MRNRESKSDKHWQAEAVATEAWSINAEECVRLSQIIVSQSKWFIAFFFSPPFIRVGQ